MKFIVCRFSERGELVSDTFAMTLWARGTSILLDKHKIFVKFEKDTGCLTMFMAKLVEVYGSEHAIHHVKCERW